MAFDLEDRTLEFGKQVIGLCSALPKNSVNFKLVDHWPELVLEANPSFKERIDRLLDESGQLVKILAAIYAKSVYDL